MMMMMVMMMMMMMMMMCLLSGKAVVKLPLMTTAISGFVRTLQLRSVTSVNSLAFNRTTSW